MSGTDPLVIDCLVAGGGTAGCAAAIACARRGHAVLLVEEANALGGTSTTGGVTSWFANLDGLGDVFAGIRAALAASGGLDGNAFDGEHLKLHWQLACEAAGVRLLFHAGVCEAQAGSGRITAAAAMASSRRISVHPRFVVDATGEGDVAALAGAPFELGDAQGRTLHCSLTATLQDSGRAVTPWLPPGLEPITDDAGLPGLDAVEDRGDGRLYLNMTKVMGVDTTDPFALSAAECAARRQLFRVVHHLQRTRHPRHRLATTAARIGIREGRRIIGQRRLRLDDIRRGAPSDDGICVATAQIDFHSLSTPGHGGWRERVAPYQIPWGCLLPQGMGNLAVAGKCISADQAVHSSCRMTPTVCAMGQAAGTAVALALEAGHADLRDLDVRALQRQLSADGMELDPRRHAAFAPAHELGGSQQEALR